MEENKINNVIAEESSAKNNELELIYLEMAKAGVMYGHKRSRRDPHFELYVFAIRNGIEIIDLEQTLDKIKEVTEEIKKFKNEGKKILLVGTQVSARDAIIRLADILDSSYVVNKWIGGLITNFKNIKSRIEYYIEQKRKEENNEFKNYTKKEQLEVHRKIDKMSNKFEGLENYSNVPDVLFIIDSSIKGHRTAIAEAKKKGIKVVGIIDNDDNPNEFDNFIPSNDHSKISIDWIINKMISYIK